MWEKTTSAIDTARAPSNDAICVLFLFVIVLNPERHSLDFDFHIHCRALCRPRKSRMVLPPDLSWQPFVPTRFLQRLKLASDGLSTLEDPLRLVGWPEAWPCRQDAAGKSFRY